MLPIVLLEGLGQLKNLMTSLGIESATLQNLVIDFRKIVKVKSM
jgi:hypothetical protein